MSQPISCLEAYRGASYLRQLEETLLHEEGDDHKLTISAAYAGGLSITSIIDDMDSIDFTLIPQLTETVLFTAYSAIPMADLVRGFYDELGLLVPQVDRIWVHPSNTEKPIPCVEADRLITKVKGKYVAVLDQYVSTGQTLQNAVNGAYVTGAESVMPIGGKWYHQADKTMLKVDATSSKLSSELDQIGRSVAKNI